MADDSSFTFKTKKSRKEKEKESTVKTRKPIAFEEDDVSIASETEKKSVATESESSNHSYENYVEAYAKLSRDTSSEQTINVSTTDEKRNHSRNDERVCESDPNTAAALSQMRAEIEALKVKVSDQSLDSAFNKIMANIDNLSSHQKRAMLMALASSMK
nr:NSP5 [Rotavirus I]